MFSVFLFLFFFFSACGFLNFTLKQTYDIPISFKTKPLSDGCTSVRRAIFTFTGIPCIHMETILFMSVGMQSLHNTTAGPNVTAELVCITERRQCAFGDTHQLPNWDQQLRPSRHE